MSEVVAETRAEEVADMLVDALLNRPAQERLFEPDPFAKRLYDSSVESLGEQFPDRLVIDAAPVQESRYQAAMYGAGFHPSQFDAITYQETGESGVEIVHVGLGFLTVRHIAETVHAHNRMRDEVNESLFAELVPTTRFTSGFYVTQPEDLRSVFIYDYLNLQTCRKLGFDLLYERSD